jgi:hypothetical protein
MGESVSPSDVFNDLAYEFAERLRHGERPSLQEYTDRYPELAAEIRELFPTLVIVEQLRPISLPARRHRKNPSLSGWETIAFCAKSVGAEWASCTRPSTRAWVAAWP